MRASGLAAVIGAAAVAGGCVTGVPHCCAIVMPARYDAGAVVASDRDTPGAHFALGASWASATVRPDPPVDVALGYVIEVRGDRSGMAKATSARPDLGSYFGGYLEVDRLVAATRHQRAFLGVRGELLAAEPDGPADRVFGYGVTARAAWEVLRTGRGTNWIGALAAGVFAEASSREFDNGVIEQTVVAGVSFRVPVVFIRARR